MAILKSQSSGPVNPSSKKGASSRSVRQLAPRGAKTAAQRQTVAPATPPAAASIPTANDVPATCGMLGAVRTELLERIDQSRFELRAEMREMKHELRAEMHEMKGELRAEMHEMKGELRAEIGAVAVGLDGVRAELSGVKAEVSRIACLMEEQNARNKIVLDALVSVIDRQGRVEQRVDSVEATVRDLASARAP